MAVQQEEATVKTQVRPEVEVQHTWKPYVVAYEIIKALRPLEPGSVVEVTTKDNKGVVQDLMTWSRVTGNEIVSSRPESGGTQRWVIRKGEPRRSQRRMTVIVSTASLEQVLFPLEKAFAGAVLGMEVNVLFEGSGVRLLRRGYRPRLSGVVGGLFTSKVDQVMRGEIGWPTPRESILALQDLGARIYSCGPSMIGYGVREEDLIVRDCEVAAVVTWVNLLADSDVTVFSRAQFERP